MGLYHRYCLDRKLYSNGGRSFLCDMYNKSVSGHSLHFNNRSKLLTPLTPFTSNLLLSGCQTHIVGVRSFTLLDWGLWYANWSYDLKETNLSSCLPSTTVIYVPVNYTVSYNFLPRHPFLLGPLPKWSIGPIEMSSLTLSSTLRDRSSFTPLKKTQFRFLVVIQNLWSQ